MATAVPPSQNSSFIPKRGSSQRRRPGRNKQLLVLSVVSYSLLFAAIIAAAATLFYQNFVMVQFQDQVTALNNAIQVFNTDDLERVSEFDSSLKHAIDRSNNSVSIVSLLDALDIATIRPVQITDLNIERQVDDHFVVAGSVTTNSFDAAIFQRKILSANRRLFNDVVIEDVVNFDSFTEGDAAAGQATASSRTVQFEFGMTIPVAEVLSADRYNQVSVTPPLNTTTE